MPAKKKTTKTSGNKKASEPRKVPGRMPPAHKCKTNNTCGGCVYGLGVIGALVYYLSTASTFWIGLYGVLKALLWPGFLIYEVLKFLGA